jgi:glycosyltransferase involved in cell wall biosynthesis
VRSVLLPSRREGYGLVVVETLSKGTPVVLVRGEDSASVELIGERVNGFVAADVSPAELAAAVVEVRDSGTSLRDSTHAWFARNANRLSLDASLATVVEAYGDA